MTTSELHQIIKEEISKIQENENSLNILAKFLKKSLNNAKIDTTESKYIKVQTLNEPTRFLEIYPHNSLYGINIHSGTIENPSKALNARWYNFGDKYYDLKGVLNIVNKYGIK